MNKLLLVSVLLALLAISVESFRMPRQAKDEEQGTLTMISNTIKSYYNNMVNMASDCLESLKALQLKEKVNNLYTETTTILSTYNGIVQDQLYHFFYSQDA
ncbi:apolipoprotein C-II [Dunckerocampus dactyliophorus]|uniref:apolipoprotein C-II n=1 Tax=Dunckerocampus dactyliophorus TaxID=161453 RepID=UPI00240704A6|nr:apolipoprotein C-II [Dunckerocampus dactyliophorus]